jgi:ABC-type multidrug transport system fused ATPase/permease subunit
MTTTQKLWRMLSYEQLCSAGALLGLMVIGMLLETLGIGLVIPALALMTQSDLTIKYPSLAPWLTKLGNPSHERLVITGMMILVGVYAIKAIFLAFLAWRQARFVAGLQADFSQRLFAGYLRQPYTFHLQRNSAQLIRNTIGQSGTVSGTFQQGLSLLTEMLVMLGISVMLLVVEPLGALIVVSSLGLAGWGFNRFTRSHILRWGEALQLHEGFRIQHLQEGLGGAKDVKLLGRESEFIAQYKRHNSGSARVMQRQSTMLALPRLWLELLAVCGLAGLVLTMVGQGKPLEALLPTLGLFAAAAFRLMPSANRVLGAVQNMRFTLPMIDTVYSELQLLDKTTPPQRGTPLRLKNVLSLNGVSFCYSSAEIYALHKVSLTIPQGTSAGFIGGSGAGKSTLVDLILGLLTPNEGTINVDGVNIQTSLRGWQDQIGYVPQSIFLTDDSLRRNVAFGLPADQINDAAIWRAIGDAQLEQFVKELPHGLDTIVGERGIRLSGGQRQRIGIARALYLDPPVIVLDEATSSLDTITERGVMETVRALRGKKTLLIVAHRLSTVENCDRLFQLERGKIVREGSFEYVTNEPMIIHSVSPSDA